MLDTLKCGIPLTESQFKKLHKLLTHDENWQWVQHQPSTGDLRFLRHRGLLSLDNPSFHRNIYWDIPNIFAPEQCYLTLELSIPKYWYGHNIHLLYDYVVALRELKKLLELQLHCKFVDVLQWQVWRVDLCYAWRMPNQALAEHMLDSLKRLKFPHKKPNIYDSSLLFPGKTYSIKFYLKYPEFKAHDRKALLKDKASLEWVNYLEELSKGVLRFEATLRRKYLKRKGINIISDLLKNPYEVVWNVNFLEPYKELAIEEADFIQGNVRALISTLSGGCNDDEFIYYGLDFWANPNHRKLYYEVDENNKVVVCSIIENENPVTLMQGFLVKFLGNNRKMHNCDVVHAKLFALYKSEKANVLLGFWLAVQKYGISRVKESCSKTTFYRNKQQLKAAGCSLVEKSNGSQQDNDFLADFSIDVPSPYVSNKFDDFRDGANITNPLPNSFDNLS